MRAVTIVSTSAILFSIPNILQKSPRKSENSSSLEECLYQPMYENKLNPFKIILSLIRSDCEYSFFRSYRLWLVNNCNSGKILVSSSVKRAFNDSGFLFEAGYTNSQ